MTLARAIFAVVLASLAGIGTANAYEIAPRAPLHEAMTMLSQQCLHDHGGREPVDCSAYHAQLPYYSGLSYSRDRHAQPHASRWPDDPGRLLRGRMMLKYGLTFLACKPRISRSSALDEIGLLCSSHFGELQFMHAMRSSQAESYGETRRRILDWARFSYALAAGTIAHDRNYCQAVAEQGGATAPLLRPDSFSFCGDGSDGRAADKWTIATPFVLRCSNLIFATSCDETSGDAARRQMRATALGALLHLVQDSFSQSHVRRGPVAGDGLQARIVCLPASGFDYYSGQPDHKRADGLPLLDSTCTDPSRRAIDDSITAGARLLWMVAHDAPADRAVDYIEERVLGDPQA